MGFNDTNYKGHSPICIIHDHRDYSFQSNISEYPKFLYSWYVGYMELKVKSSNYRVILTSMAKIFRKVINSRLVQTLILKGKFPMGFNNKKKCIKNIAKGRKEMIQIGLCPL